MNETADLTTETYRDEINSMADDIAKKDGVEERLEAIHTVADSHKWVTYNDYNTRLIDVAETEPHEWGAFVDDKKTASYQEVITAMAFCVMRLDLRRAVEDRL